MTTASTGPVRPDGFRRLPPTALATCVLPWDERLRFDEPAFREHVRLVAGHMTRHLYVFGTAGEGYAVTETQFREVARVFWDEARRCEATPMLGVISTSLGTVIERIEFGLELGYRQFQISFPSWGAVRDAEMDDFFDQTCGRFPEAQFLHYNTPRGGRVLTGREYGRLAAEYASLAAVKFTSSDAAVVAELVRNTAPVQCFLTEPAYVLAPPVRGGARAAARARRLAKGQHVELTGQQHALLRRSRNGVLVTTGPAGSPHAGPVWYLWDGAEIRISTPRTTQKVRDIEHDPRVAFCVDDQVAGEYVTLYGEAVIVSGERVTELTWPLLLAYLHREEAAARWSRINADGSRVVIILRPARIAGREQVR